MTHQAIRTYDYHTWANQKVFAHLKELPEDIYFKEIESVFSSISKVLTHIHDTDRLWLSVMAGDPFEDITAMMSRLREDMEGEGMQETEARFLELSEQYRAFFDRQDDMDTCITAQHPRFGKQQYRLSDLVHHVANHGTYHRGNITAMLRQMGHKGVSTDFVFYIMP